jgi:hypothetical protein
MKAVKVHQLHNDHQLNVGDVLVYNHDQDKTLATLDIGYISSKVVDDKKNGEWYKVIWFHEKNSKGEQHIYTTEESINTIKDWTAGLYFPVVR